MPYVYILSDYEEHGAENVCATLDRAKLVGMVRSNWSHQEPSDAELNQEALPYGVSYVQSAANDAIRAAINNDIRARRRARYDAWIADSVEGLEALLKKPDAELAGRDGYNCQRGWGGLMLHVVELT